MLRRGVGRSDAVLRWRAVGQSQFQKALVDDVRRMEGYALCVIWPKRHKQRQRGISSETRDNGVPWEVLCVRPRERREETDGKRQTKRKVSVALLGIILRRHGSNVFGREREREREKRGRSVVLASTNCKAHDLSSLQVFSCRR